MAHSLIKGYHAHQLRTWNKEAYAKALALEMALGTVCRKRKPGKMIHLGQPVPTLHHFSNKLATARREGSHPA